MKKDVFQAIADPTRRAILSLIAVHAMTPNALAEHFDMSRQAVSKHIQVLKESELVKQKQEGREIFYLMQPKKLKEVDRWLETFRNNWEERFSNLDQVLKKIKK
jgi:DNA-binding transcriptional ArsR family regulator